MAVRSKRVEFELVVGPDGAAWIPGRDDGRRRESWTPEHLLLEALGRCALASIRYSARRAGIEVTASAHAHGAVTRRASDGRFAFTSIDVTVTLDDRPDLSEEALANFRHHSERGCFIGASLNVEPNYIWRYDGQALRLGSADVRASPVERASPGAGDPDTDGATADRPRP